MNDQPQVDPLICLFQTLLGAVVGIYAAFEYVEKSFHGMLQSLLWAFLALACIRMVLNGVYGLLERPGLSSGSWGGVLVFSVVGGLLGPSMSDARQKSYEAATWEQVKDSRNAILWQNRYTKRVPEVYRHKGWESRYTQAVCAYSLETKEYTSLGWYAQEAFREHPEKYDDSARQAISKTVALVFQKASKRPQDQKLGDGKTQRDFQRILEAIAETPEVSLLWKSQLPASLPDSVRQGAEDEFESILYGKLQREFAKLYSSNLLRFVTPADQRTQYKPKSGDLTALVTIEAPTDTKSGYRWNFEVLKGDDTLFAFHWKDPKPATSSDVLGGLRSSVRDFCEVLSSRLGLNATPERNGP